MAGVLASPAYTGGRDWILRTLILYLLTDFADLTLFFTVGGFLALMVLLFR